MDKYSDELNLAKAGLPPEASSAESDIFLQFFQNCPIPMVIVDVDTLFILKMNTAASSVYSQDLSEGPLSLRNVISYADFEEFSTSLKSSSAANDSRTCRFISKDGETLERHTLVQPLWFGGSSAKLLIIQEGNQTIAERALFASEERFAKAFHSSPIAVCITRLEDGLFIEANERFLALMGYTREDLVGRTEVDLSFWRNVEERQKFLDSLIRGGRVKDVERTFRGRKGGRRDALLSAEVIGLDGCACLLVMIRDVTDARKNAEKIRSYQRELRSLASQLSLAEEVERRRIAGELHDHIGQNLAMLKISLGVINQKVRSTAARKEMEKMRGLLEETLNSARSLCFELSPPVLYEVGFESALEWLAERTQEEHGILVEVEKQSESKPLQEVVKVTLFTVVRELLTNIVKHARATKASISLKRYRRLIRIVVKDDGVGFEVRKATVTGKPSGFGLFSIRERITHLGGKMRIDSSPGKGTQVVVIAPLKIEKWGEHL
jgi:PAS domain S-box-containing protein